MKYLQSFRGLRPLGPHQGAALDLLVTHSTPQTPSCICNDLRSLHIVPPAQYLAAPSSLSTTETFLHTKIPHPFCLSKNILLCRRKKKIIAPKNLVKKNFSICKNYIPPPPPPENQMVRPLRCLLSRRTLFKSPSKKKPHELTIICRHERSEDGIFVTMTTVAF